MYKIASDKRQAGLHHGRPADWVNGVEKLSVQDHFQQLKNGIRVLDKRIVEATGKDRKDLVKRKMDMQNELVAFKEKHGLERKERLGFNSVFIDCAKDMLPKVQFDMIMNAAKREFEKATAAAGQPTREPHD
jgi:hypothetical protein